jgi:hypothetical protein
MNAGKRSFLKKAESGFSVTIQAIYYVYLLFFFFALVYDFGNVGYVQTIATNAARVAAQDAAKEIDVQTFLDTQEVRLSADALDRAQGVVDGMTAGQVTINSIAVNNLKFRDVIVVRGTATAQMPIIGSIFGINNVQIPVEGFAEPAFGISFEGQ